ncbi:ATP-binding protein [Methylicorpusculum oleiharenae]|uniref:ATP-binding protein n=1 Tax=Methylicorpusculum oleiharenae TaxID=1338687 RepID=UPI00135BD37A|nr:ATP-binding protein [Methylicorpusculum oleiharenae]MCD2453647.1 ATP-binding protein [Methylicorpusculum oleiharenae]
MKQVAMKVNQSNLVKSLKFSFTNKTTVLGELMQNARRAGATSVNFDFAPETKILRVTDNGCGIDSIETLLTVAESGWDADVVAQEHPFGIGFLSALFACRHITVVSKSGRISVNTDDVLSFKPVEITPVPEWDNVTTITMVAVDLELSRVEHELKRLASAFPIAVLFNGTELDRPHAINSGLKFLETEVGLISLACFDQPNVNNYAYVMYLQGLPIYKSSSYGSFGSPGYHVIHLDSSKFFGRLPDRDELVDKDEVVNLAKAALKGEIEKHLLLMKSSMPFETFVAYYDMISEWGLLSILNDVPVIPIKALTEYSSYPNCSEESFGEFETRPAKPIHQNEVISGQVQLVTFDECIEAEGSALSMYVFKKGFYVYPAGSKKLDEGHWLLNHLRDLNQESVRIELINESHRAYFDGQFICINAVFCQSYQIWVGDDNAEIDDDAMFDGSNAIVPEKDTTGSVVTQASSFRDEGDFQQSAYDQDEYDFSQFVVANTSSDPAHALKQLLPGFSACPSVFGKSFVVTLDENGRVASVTSA